MKSGTLINAKFLLLTHVFLGGGFCIGLVSARDTAKGSGRDSVGRMAHNAVCPSDIMYLSDVRYTFFYLLYLLIFS